VANPWKRWVFIRLETTTGEYGIAEATLYGEAQAVVSELEERRRNYIGKDPFRIESIWNDWYRDSFARNTSAVNITAMGAVETACWDIVGKHYGAPIYSLLGGQIRDRVRIYANGWYTHATDAEDFAKRARAVVSSGYRALKFDPFGTAYLTLGSPEMRQSVKIIEAVRGEVGEDVELLIEGHGRFTAETAIRIARRMEQYNPRWFEEPVTPEDLNGLKSVAAKTSIPIASGERVLTKYGFVSLIESGAVHILQPDLINTGGLLEGKKISAMADAHFMTVAPHQAEGPVATATCLQLDACISNFEIQESFDEFDVEWRNDIVKNPPVIRDGSMLIPDRPGLGIDLNINQVEKHRASGVTDFNLFEKGWENRNLPKSRK
jgi:galactonate dehydratase